MPKQIKDYPEITTAVDSDKLLIQATNNNAYKCITKANLLAGLSSNGGSGNQQVNAVRWWRIRNLISPGGSDRQWIVRELAFLDANRNNITINGTPITNGNTSSVASAFDGDSSTFWVGAGQGTINSWIGYQFSSAVLPTFFRIQNLNQYGNIPPFYYSIDFSNDGTAWNSYLKLFIPQDESQYTFSLI